MGYALCENLDLGQDKDVEQQLEDGQGTEEEVIFSTVGIFVILDLIIIDICLLFHFHSVRMSIQCSVLNILLVCLQSSGT